MVGGGCTLLRLSTVVDSIKETLDNEEQKVRGGEGQREGEGEETMLGGECWLFEEYSLKIGVVRLREGRAGRGLCYWRESGRYRSFSCLVIVRPQRWFCWTWSVLVSDYTFHDS